MKKILIATSVCAVALIAAGAAVQDQEPAQSRPQEKAQSPADKARLEVKVRKLMEVTGAAEMGKQAMAQMLKAFRGMPNLPAGFLDKFQEAAKPQDLVNLVVPIYMKHVKEADLDEVTKFMMSPVGKRWLDANKKITLETMRVSQKWGRELAQKVMADLKAGK